MICLFLSDEPIQGGNEPIMAQNRPILGVNEPIHPPREPIQGGKTDRFLRGFAVAKNHNLGCQDSLVARLKSHETFTQYGFQRLI